VLVTVIAAESDTRIDLHVPQADATILMACGDEATVNEESHAADLGVSGTLHHSDHLHFLCIPKPNGVVQTARDHFGIVSDALLRLLLELRWLQAYDF
jgi:hypothetical protein